MDTGCAQGLTGKNSCRENDRGERGPSTFLTGKGVVPLVCGKAFIHSHDLRSVGEMNGETRSASLGMKRA